MSLSHTWFFRDRYFLPHRLKLLARMLERETVRELHAGWTLTAADWRALAYVCTQGSASAAEIRAAFQVDRAEVSRAVTRLVDAGLVRREAARNRDNRQLLTPAGGGETVFREIQAARRAYFEWILQDLSAGERRTLDEAFGKIAARMAQREPSDTPASLMGQPTPLPDEAIARPRRSRRPPA